MKSTYVLAVSIAALAMVTSADSRAAESALAAQERPRVMILGTFHFQGSTTDAISVTMGEVRTPLRQEEIALVVERLARFSPTKIMVEVDPSRETTLNATYRAYLRGDHELGESETEQIAMRLAARLELDRLHAVDHRQDMDFQRMLSAAQSSGQEELLARFQSTMAEVQETISKAQHPDRTILDALRFHNSDWAHRANGLYLQLALMGSSENPAGAEVIGGWYERNLKIYANIARKIESPEDRVLVVFGSGHLAHLASFFDQNPRYDWISALDFLGEPE